MNIASHGFTVAFAAILLPQLRREDSPLKITDEQGSWIASVIGITLIIGNFTVPIIMGKFGRKAAMITSIVPMAIAWVILVIADSFAIIITARLLQGLAMGLGGSLGPILIGEYTSPKLRGAFLTSIALSISIAVFTVHALGSYLSWHTTALVCAFVCVFDLGIVVFSPESPVWLADQGRYDESTRIFRWLRGHSEDDELNKMIETRKLQNEIKGFVLENEPLKKRIKKKIVYFKTTVKKKAFYKPIIIMLHVFAVGQWSGAAVLVGYTVDVFQNVVGKFDFALMLMLLDIQRIISSTGAMFLVKKIKRRTMLFTSAAINLIAFALIVLYTCLKSHGLILWDHPIIGILLIHAVMFSVATGPLTLSFIFAGELYPLEYKSLAGGLSFVFYSICLFLVLKTFPFLVKHLEIYGAFCVYFVIVLYCVIVLWFTLPETKDRTLQDIENEYTGKNSNDEKFKALIRPDGNETNHNRNGTTFKMR